MKGLTADRTGSVAGWHFDTFRFIIVRTYSTRHFFKFKGNCVLRSDNSNYLITFYILFRFRTFVLTWGVSMDLEIKGMFVRERERAWERETEWDLRTSASKAIRAWVQFKMAIAKCSLVDNDTSSEGVLLPSSGWLHGATSQKTVMFILAVRIWNFTKLKCLWWSQFKIT